MRSPRANKNLMAVSANNRETGINVEQTLDTTMLVAMGDVINLEPRRENNGDEQTGKEEPDTVYDLGALASGSFNFEKAQPQHFAFLLAFGLGQVATVAAGTGYEHTIIPIDGDLDGDRSVPTFTGAQRFGDVIAKRLFASLAVDSFTATFAKDSWCKIVGTLKGTGKVTNSVIEETVSALNDAVELTLAANGVEGADAQTRLDNVQRIQAELTPGVWTEVDYSAVSAASPAVITNTSAGGDGLSSIDYKILYVPTEAAWATFPARVTETPLRVTGLTVNFGGAWNGAAFDGGREMTSEISSVEWGCNNNLQVEFVPGSAGAYASRIWRDGRGQTLKMTREFRDYILQQHIDSNDTFGVHLLAEGAVFDAPHKYQVELIFPKCAVLTSPISVDGKRLAEAGDLVVLEDDTYGSVIAKVKNLQATYAA
ncbi:MAG: hypothetical protein ABFS18_02160 [Thermodesulfobacteriota bacterium]